MNAQTSQHKNKVRFVFRLTYSKIFFELSAPLRFFLMFLMAITVKKHRRIIFHTPTVCCNFDGLPLLVGQIIPNDIIPTCDTSGKRNGIHMTESRFCCHNFYCLRNSLFFGRLASLIIEQLMKPAFNITAVY